MKTVRRPTSDYKQAFITRHKTRTKFLSMWERETAVRLARMKINLPDVDGGFWSFIVPFFFGDSQFFVATGEQHLILATIFSRFLARNTRIDRREKFNNFGISTSPQHNFTD